MEEDMQDAIHFRDVFFRPHASWGRCISALTTGEIIKYRLTDP